MKQVSTAGKLAAGCVAQPWQCSTQVQPMTGTKKHASICTYANQGQHWLDILLKIAQ